MHHNMQSIKNMTFRGSGFLRSQSAHIRSCFSKTRGLNTNMNEKTNLISLTPQQARMKFRTEPGIEQTLHNSSGMCKRYMQANVAIVPSYLADDFAEFCRLNQAACCLLYRSGVGEVGAPILAKGSDIRTDLLRYIVTYNEDGQEKSSRVDSLTDFPFDDMVTFYIGCSFSFDDAMMNAGIPIQNVIEKNDISMFNTDIECFSAGVLKCPNMVVSMRPIKKHLLEKTVAVTSPYEAVHGAPIHIGDPDMIGISDILQADLGGNSHFDSDDDIPVFWACGVTSSVAIRAARSPICFSHSPGCMFFADVPFDDYFKAIKPSYGDDVPKVVTVYEKPFFASVLGKQTLDRINKLEDIIQLDPGNRGINHLHIPGEVVKGALMVSHASSVAIATGFPVFKDHSPPDETDGLPGVISMARTFQALGKTVTLIASYYNGKLLEEAVEAFVKCGILQNGVNVEIFQVAEGETKEDAAFNFLFHDKESKRPKYDVLVSTEAVCRTSDGRYKTMRNMDLTDVCTRSPVDELFLQANKSNKIGTVSIGDGGNEIGMGKVQENVIKHINNGSHIAASVPADRIITAGVSNWGSWALAMATYLLYECPHHSRYRRRGIGLHQPVAMEIAITDVEQERQILEYFVGKGVRDGCTGKAEMSVDGLSFEPHHVKILQQLMDVCQPINTPADSQNGMDTSV